NQSGPTLKIRFEQILIVEPEDMASRLFSSIHQAVQVKIFGTDISFFQHSAFYPIEKTAPVVLANQYDREPGNFTGLDQGNGLKELVHRAESSRQDNKPLGILHEHDFPDKEIIELKEFVP